MPNKVDTVLAHAEPIIFELREKFRLDPTFLQHALLDCHRLSVCSKLANNDHSHVDEVLIQQGLIESDPEPSSQTSCVSSFKARSVSDITEVEPPRKRPVKIRRSKVESSVVKFSDRTIGFQIAPHD